MSEYIKNREYRQQVLKEIIAQLHSGKPVDAVSVMEVTQNIEPIQNITGEKRLMSEQ